MTRISGIILTHNEEQHIEECIGTLQWTDSILVFDSFSTDRTTALATTAGAKVIQHPFENYGAQRNAALDASESDWVVFVDADERVPQALAEEIKEKIKGAERGWWMPRHNYIFGKLTRGAGWYPDYQLRVLHRESARYDARRPVHETVILDGTSGYLNNPIIHYNYRDLRQFISKQERYSDIEAKLRFDEGIRPRTRTYVTMPLREFVRRFITLKGYIDGFHGLRLSAIMAYYEFQVWRRVARMAQAELKEPG